MGQAIKENLGSHKLSNSHDGPLDHDTHLAQCVWRTYPLRPNTIGSWHNWESSISIAYMKVTQDLERGRGEGKEGGGGVPKVQDNK